MRKALGALTLLFLVFLAGHLFYLPTTLDDLDAINFALGVRDFDVSRHQPHPPGYPLFIAAAKLSTATLNQLGVPAADARGLALLSAVSGALLIPALFALFRALDGDVHHAWWATLLTVASPLVWFTAFRPLSDVAGLAAVVFAQALLIRSIMGAPALRHLVAGALLAGLAIGIRAQTFTLTLPLLTLALVLPGVARGLRARVIAVAALAAGVAVWVVPLLIASGGPGRYLAALGQQGGEDFGGVVMFWNFPTIGVGLSALRHTFVSPWASMPLALVVWVAAAAGVAAVARIRPLAMIVAVMTLPYAVFHLLFHEPVTVRYALPLVPLTAWLAVRGISRFAAPAVPVAVGALAAWALVLAVPAGMAYGTVAAPIFRAVAALASARQESSIVVASHRRVFTESRRARTWLQEPSDVWLPAPRDFEWLELTRAWKSGHAGPAWFFADPRRSDLALIDSRGSQITPYRWPFDDEVFVGGARPGELDVHVYESPGWFLEEGWALTPETAGVAVREGWMPHVRPSVGWIRRQPGAAEMVLGGRHLGVAGDPPLRILATIDGLTVLDREVDAGFFVDRVALPPGALSGRGAFAPLQVRAVPVSGGAARVDLEQFDLQPKGVPMFAFEGGWHEPEYDPATGRSWRWLSQRGELWVRPTGDDVTLRFAAESPLRYFDAAPRLRLSAGGRELARLSPSDDFTWDVTIPAATLASSAGRVVVESDRSFVPGDGSGADQRNLAIRVYRVTVD